MSMFDHIDQTINNTTQVMFGDIAEFIGGALNNGKTATGSAILDVDKTYDNNNVIAEVLVIEYLREIWPNPRRGDTIKIKGETYQITQKRDATSLTQVVEVAHA